MSNALRNRYRADLRDMEFQIFELFKLQELLGQEPFANWGVDEVKMVLEQSRQFAYEVARMMAKGEGTLEASMIKAYVCKAAEWVTREAMQIHGGFGYAEEYTVSRLFVDARVLSIFEGADETLCLKVIARQLVSRHQAAASV